jgi:hypothetical protein
MIKAGGATCCVGQLRDLIFGPGRKLGISVSGIKVFALKFIANAIERRAFIRRFALTGGNRRLRFFRWCNFDGSSYSFPALLAAVLPC